MSSTRTVDSDGSLALVALGFIAGTFAGVYLGFVIAATMAEAPLPPTPSTLVYR